MLTNRDGKAELLAVPQHDEHVGRPSVNTSEETLCFRTSIFLDICRCGFGLLSSILLAELS